jgi:predicted dehydrogenase
MESIGIGLVGAGLFGRNHAIVYSRLAETQLLAVCDVDRDRAAQVAAEFGASGVYGRIEDVLAHPGVQAVSIATPDFVHTDDVVKALEAGKHVLCEKPLAMTVADAERIREAARRSPAKLMVDFANRVSPPIAAAKKTIDDGELGRPIHVMARLSNTLFVPFKMLSWADKSSALWFLGSHVIDLLRYLTGQEVVRVYAVAGHGLLRSRGIDIPDVYLSTLEFSGGVIAQMENSWVLPEDNPMIYDLKIEIVGDKGQVQIDTSHNGAFRKMTGQGMRYTDVFGITPAGDTRTGGFAMEGIGRFIDAIVRDAPVLAGVEDGVAVTRILVAIEESARGGAPVVVAEMTGKGS